VRELCTQVGEAPQLAPTLLGLCRYYATRAEHQAGREVGEQLLRLTDPAPDSPQRALAHYALGTNALFRGELPLARPHLEACRTIYETHPHARPDVHAGHDPNVACRLYGTLTLWLLSYPEQACRWNDEGMTLASRLSHPYTMAYAWMATTWLYQYLREDLARLQESIQAATTLCTEYDFGPYLAGNILFQGWVLSMQGQHEKGLAQQRQALTRSRETIRLFTPYHLALLAQAYERAGQITEGLAALDEALALVDMTGEKMYSAEIHRIKGKLLLSAACGARRVELTPEGCYQTALDIARQQQAKSWELRAATSLARLWQSQGKRQDAYDLLAPVYGWFTEGFDTADLKDAKTLLHELDA
jgi:predicted ATPase